MGGWGEGEGGEEGDMRLDRGRGGVRETKKQNSEHSDYAAAVITSPRSSKENLCVRCLYPSADGRLYTCGSTRWGPLVPLHLPRFSTEGQKCLEHRDSFSCRARPI